jgi:hypothetical protein
MAKRRSVRVEVYASPTNERLSHCAAWVVGNARRRSDRTVTVLDGVEHSHHRGAFTDGQLHAAQKYRHHWYHSGLRGLFATPSLELGPVFHSDRADFLPRSENEELHRRQYRAAVRLIGPAAAAQLEQVICHGKGEPLRNGAVATLQVALERLRTLWGL